MHGPGFFSDVSQWTLELDHAKTWLDEQRQAWMHTAEERAAALDLSAQRRGSMSNAKRGCTRQRDARPLSPNLSAQRRGSMSNAKRGCTRQRNARPLAELERAKTWLDEQCQAWMHTAEERAAALAELERAKTWLDEQLPSVDAHGRGTRGRSRRT